MNKNIPATLNLNKSLSIFEDTVSKILEITNVSDCDGTNIRDREEKIRDAALILAGQCVALLLCKLSQLPEAKETAITQTKGWWRKKTKKNGSKTWQILTMGNVAVSLRLPYVVERNETKTKKRKSRGQGFCPFLRWLAMEEGVTPLVYSTIAQYGSISSSFATAHESLINWGINISLKRIERLTYNFCHKGLSLRDSKVFQLERDKLPTGEVLNNKRVVISVDGGRSRIRIYKKEKPSPKTKRVIQENG